MDRTLDWMIPLDERHVRRTLVAGRALQSPGAACRPGSRDSLRSDQEDARHGPPAGTHASRRPAGDSGRPGPRVRIGASRGLNTCGSQHRELAALGDRRDHADGVLRAATPTGHTWPWRRPVKLRRVVVGLGAHWRSAFSANVVVLVSARENEQELRPRRRCAAAPRAEQAGRLELAKVVGPSHLSWILHTRREQLERWLNSRDASPPVLTKSKAEPLRVSEEPQSSRMTLQPLQITLMFPLSRFSTPRAPQRERVRRSDAVTVT
jgi:hypothetical protein